MAPKVLRQNATPTDLHLLVSGELTHVEWDRSRIEQSLAREVGLDPGVCAGVAQDVERRVSTLGLDVVTTSLIRELVDVELIRRGFLDASAKHMASIPQHDIETFLFGKSNDNANVSNHSPESVAMNIIERQFKQFALNRVFSHEVAEAHQLGTIYLHDLGMVNRNYCSSHCPAAILKHGLNLPGLDVVSGPPKSARSLTGQLCTFLAAMQAYYAGALGIAFANVFYAPLTEHLTYKELTQEMQHLVFQLSQTAFSRGGQTLFVDLNVHLTIPGWLGKHKAIGLGGVELDRTYSTYSDEVLRIARVLLDIMRDGDHSGSPFSFPKGMFHITGEAFSNACAREVIEYACEVSSHNGSPYFVFDHDDISTSACCRLRAELDEDYTKDPAQIRFCGAQNVSINFPQAGYRAGKGASDDALFDRIAGVVEIAIKAHKEKRAFLEKLMEPGGCLEAVGKPILGTDGPYVDLDRATWIVGIIGLNDMLKFVTGKELHESAAVQLRGITLISRLAAYLDQRGREEGMILKLEETPGESAVRRLAKVDLQHYPEAREVVSGTYENPYYQNSIHFRADAPISLVDRIQGQSKYHKFIKAGAIVHAFVGEESPPGKSIYNLLRKVHNDGQCSQFVVSPEFTNCRACCRTFPGGLDVCPECGNKQVDVITRIVGYYSRTRNWNASKIEELKDRRQGNYRP